MNLRKIAFIGNDFDKFDHDILFPIIERLGAEVARYHPYEISVYFHADKINFFHKGEPITPDLVVGWVFEDILHQGINILEAFERSGTPVINRGHVLYCAQNKFINTTMMQVSHSPFPPVLSGRNLKDLKSKIHQFNFPVVVKPIIGFGGNGIFKAKNYNELFSLLQEESDDYYVQPFINNPGRDIRIICINHKVVNAIYRYASEGQWITNLSSGAIPVNFEPDKALIEIAERASTAAGTLYSGLDIVESLSEKDYTVLEVNSCPSTHYAYSNEDEEPKILYYLADYLVSAAHDFEKTIKFWKPKTESYNKVKASV